MGLKLVDDGENNKNEGGLRLSGMPEQTVPNSGESFDNKLKKNFQIEDIDYVTKGSQKVIAVQAYGQYDITSDGIMDYTNKTVPTQLFL